ncbi:MAG: prenyltransferase, partial [Acidimicrobiales bacterium]
MSGDAAGAGGGDGLDPGELAETAAWLASMQLPNGMLPWYRGGHGDPWNHLEATMALAAGGRWAEVERALAWLAAHQLADGSWCRFYVPDGVLDPRRDPNVCAYVATAVWWCSELGGPAGLLEALWPVIDAAISWTLRQQLSSGEIVWSVGPDGAPGGFALLAANSSLHQSLGCALRAAGALGRDRPHWAAAAAELGAAVEAAVAGRPTAFAP